MPYYQLPRSTLPRYQPSCLVVNPANARIADVDVDADEDADDDEEEGSIDWWAFWRDVDEGDEMAHEVEDMRDADMTAQGKVRIVLASLCWRART